MDLTDMLEENKSKKNNTAQLLIHIFTKNWNEKFLFDTSSKKTITYGDFFSMVLRYKERLSQLKLEKKDTVCLLFSNSIDMISLYFTCLIMQLRVVPIDPLKGQKDISEILSKVNHKIIISNVNKEEIPVIKLDKISNKETISEKKKSDIDELNVFMDIDYDDLFLITFTSGSTGIPKGVMHSFNNLIHSANFFNKKFNFNNNNVFYHNLPMSYMAGILNLIILPFISNSKIVLGERFSISNISNFWNIPIQYSVNTFWFVPTTIALLLKLDRGNEGIKYCKDKKIIGCVGTAALDQKIKKDFETKYNISLYQSYGLSETLFVTTNFPENDLSNAVGKPLDGVSLSIYEDQEIGIKVPWMFLGYTNSSTNHLFKNKYYLSGDLGEINEKGFLVINGRKKDLIIKGGMNISSKRIEDFIKEFDIFEENVVLGFEDLYMGEKIVCFFVKKSVSSDDDKKTLNNRITEKLGKEYHIDEFMELGEIPYNSNGKIDKPKIREIYGLNINANRH